MTATKTTAARIAELEATKDVMIGSDEGTHNSPTSYRVYESITGEISAYRYTTGTCLSRYTVANAEANSAGRIRWFAKAKAEIEAKRRELAALKDAARKAK